MSSNPQRSWSNTSLSSPFGPAVGSHGGRAMLLMLGATLASAAPGGWDAAASLQTARYVAHGHAAAQWQSAGRGRAIQPFACSPAPSCMTRQPMAGRLRVRSPSGRSGTRPRCCPMAKVLVAGGHYVGVAITLSPAPSCMTRRPMPGQLRVHSQRDVRGTRPRCCPMAKCWSLGDLTMVGLSRHAELYDPATNAWTAGGTLTTGRVYHTATLLPNGKVLVAGGGAVVAPIFIPADAELYDPATNSWTAAGALARGRATPHGHAAAQWQSAGRGGEFARNDAPSCMTRQPMPGRLQAHSPRRVIVHTATLLPRWHGAGRGGIWRCLSLLPRQRRAV